MTYFLDLFAGIGGFALGAEWAGMKFDKHFFSEVDDYAIRVYSRRFPGAIALGDITKIDGTRLPDGGWIIAGGFPCQDISVAGKGAGLAGARSGLWYEYARIIGELRPQYAIMENVGALTHRGLDAVLGSLAEIGYDAEWQDIRASDVGAPHRRERIWIVAYPAKVRGTCGKVHDTNIVYPCDGENASSTFVSSSEGSKALAYPDSEHGFRRPEPQLASSAGRQSRDQPARSRAAGNVADANKTQCARDGSAEPAKQEHASTGRPGSRPQWWATEPDVGRVAHGVPARVDRLKCLGNSIVPQIAEMIFREIKKW